DVSVCESGRSCESRLGRSTRPNRDLSDRSWRDACPFDGVVGAIEVNQLETPKCAQYLDLLVEPTGPVVERHAKRGVFDMVPTSPDPQHEASPGQEVDLCSLLGYERCL